MSITKNYLELVEEVKSEAIKQGRDSKEIKIVAVSKNHPIESVIETYEAGCRDFGENRIQEALPKIEEGPMDIRWHLIGTLQKNKVSKAVGPFQLIHSVDTLELAQKISEQSQKQDRITPILLQVNTSREVSKHGFTSEDCMSDFENLLSLPGIKLEGFMTMAPFVPDEIIVRKCFAELRQLRDQLATKDMPLKQLSMGMTQDYRWAIAEGATIIRVGTRIFF